MNTITDERLGRPSASELERVMNCAGYIGLKRMVESQRVLPEPKDSAAASSGTELHALNESGDLTEATYSEEETVKLIRSKEEQLVRQWANDMSIPFDEIQIVREKRFWFDVSAASAQVDVLAYWDMFAYVLDTKTGRLEVTPPVRNHQLRTCAACVVSELGFKHVRCAIVNLFGKQKAPVDYPNEDLNRIAIILRARLKEVEQPGLPVTAGDWCRYCHCVHVCTAQREKMGIAIQNRTLDWSLVTPQDRKPLWIAADMAEKAGKAIKDQLKADISSDPECAPGLKKSPDGTTRKITDAKKASLQLHAAVGGNDIDVMKAILEKSSISLENFTTLYRDMTGASKPDAEKFLETHCADFISKSPRSGSVSIVND